MTNRVPRNKAAFLAATLAIFAAIFTACENPTSLPTFTVSFNLNGGSGTAPPPPMPVEAGSPVTLPGNAGFTRPGFNFAGWSTGADGSGTIHNAGSSFTPTGNTTMYARWEPVGSFTVSFDANGGSGTVPALPANQGQGVTLPGGEALVREGQTFFAWNTRADGAGFDHPAGSLFTPIGNTTLYARWVPTITVSFNANGGNGTVPARQVGQGLGFMLPGGAGLSRDGQEFAGWNTEPEGIGVNHSSGSIFTPHGNIVLYARWLSGVVVTFDSNGGTGSVPAQAVATGSFMTLPGGAELSKPGHTFEGWNENTVGTGINRVAGSSFAPAASMTLFARWVPIPQVVRHTVTFDANEGTGAPPPPQTVDAGASVIIPGAGGLLRTGFTFSGWNENAAGTGANREAGTSFTPTGNVTLFARWVPIPEVVRHTVTFDANEGTGTPPPPQTVDAGTSVIIPNADGLSRTGHTFGGWNGNAAGTGTNREAGTSFTPTGNVTLFARWVPIPPEAANFTVTFNANQGAGSPPAPQTIPASSSITLPGGSGLSRTDHTFGGWSANAAGTQALTSPFTPTGSVTLFAIWTPAGAGTTVPGANLAEQFEWLRLLAQSNTDYVINVSANADLAPQALTLPAGRSNVTVTLRGSGARRTIRLSQNGALFTIGSGFTLVLDDNITLEGRTQGVGNATAHNTTHLVRVNSGGTLIMNAGARITGNTNSGIGAANIHGGGVRVNANGTFTMNGGEISGNSAPVLTHDGGGVFIDGAGTFTMHGGSITGNTTNRHGGGVRINNLTGNFTMHGGIISNNRARFGGGVCTGGVFTMRGGTISGNEGSQWGGGVSVHGENNARFVMHGGAISNNAQSGGPASGGMGGGVSVNRFGTLAGQVNSFYMHGGTISGNTAWEGGGVGLGGNGSSGATFNISGGLIHGNTGAAANTATNNGATLFMRPNAAAWRGTLVGGAFNPQIPLSTTNDRMDVLNGVPR